MVIYRVDTRSKGNDLSSTVFNTYEEAENFFNEQEKLFKFIELAVYKCDPDDTHEVQLMDHAVMMNTPDDFESWFK